MAARFWIGGGTNTNWNASPTTNWAATSGGTTRVAAPTVSDTVTFDGVGTNANTASVISANQSVLSLTFTSGYTNTITLNSTIILTIAGNYTDNTAHTWTVNSIVAGALTISAASTITSGGVTWPSNITFSGANTKTLVGDWLCVGTLTISSTTTFNKTTAEVMTVGGLTLNAACSGTVNLTITGGTYTGTAGFSITGIFNFAGNVTVTGNVAFSGGTLKYTSGTVTVGVGILTCIASTTFDTDGITWSSITVQGTSQTYTLNSLLTMSGTLLLNGVTTSIFAGTAGFTCATLSHTLVAAYAVTLKNSITYTITTAFTANATRLGAILSFISDDGTARANLILQNQSALCLVIASFTRIDASTGARPINPVVGTITDSPNIIIPPSSTIFYNPVTSFSKTRRLCLSNSNRVFQYK